MRNSCFSFELTIFNCGYHDFQISAAEIKKAIFEIIHFSNIENWLFWKPTKFKVENWLCLRLKTDYVCGWKPTIFKVENWLCLKLKNDYI